MSNFTANPIFDISEADTENILTSYNGLPPRAGQLMTGVVKGFLTLDSNGNPMIKVLYVAEGGDYDGYVGWENISLIPSAAFKWAALCEDVLQVSVADLAKKMKLDTNPDNETSIGTPILSIGKRDMTGSWRVGFSMRYKNYTDPATGEASRQPVVGMAFADSGQ